MARRPRLQYAGAIYHVMSRGNRKFLIFEDDCDRERLLAIVNEACERYGVRCLAYCLMGNHYHLLLEAPRGNVSSAMRHVNGVYTQYSNRRHGRTGHVFEGRFASVLVDNDLYLLTVVKYVVLNPVKAGLVAKAAGWTWSSYRGTAGLTAPPSFLNLDWLECAFGSGKRTQCQSRYRRFIDLDDDAEEPEPTRPLIGSGPFESSVRSYIGVAMYQAALPRNYRSLGKPELSELFEGSEYRRRERDKVIRRAHVVHGYRLSEIAAYLGLHPNTMSKVLRRLKVYRAGTSEIG